MRTFDFQVHSRFSYDSLSRLKDIKKKAIDEGIDGVAITDHETIKGGLKSKEYCDDDFLFITGQEVKTDLGDVIGLMINDNLNSSNFFDLVDEIKSQNGIVYLPHPSRKMKLSGEIIKENIDLVEVVNGRSSKDENLFSIKLAMDLDLPYASGSDAHTIREIGKVKTTFHEQISDEDELRKFLIDSSKKRSISGTGSYNPINHFQSSIIGTARTGKVKEFAKGITRKFIR